MDALAARLADEMLERPAPALEPERIVAPDPLLGQWLQLQLAARLDVAAHLLIQQPAEFAWGVMREELGGLDSRSVYGPPFLRWRIFDRLAAWNADDRNADDEIGRYLEDGCARKRFELADRLAKAYDRCRVFRPQSIRAWQRSGGRQNGETAWHARLWADLSTDDGKPRHWVDAIDRYRDAVKERSPGANRPRVSVFDVGAMSPTYAEFLRLAATTMEFHLYLWQPSRRFWIDSPPKQAGGYYEESCELVAAWGRSARDQQRLLREEAGLGLCPTPDDGTDSPAGDPAGDTCLQTVQRDILGLPPATPRATKAPTTPDDSLQIHVCHSATREVEVLHDRLLGLFDDHSDIQPADVLVLAPDLDTYAPLIEAVFGAAGKIGFDIGRQRLKEGAALTAFLDLLDLPGSRYTATALLAPLAADVVRRRFDIADPELELLRAAVVRAGIRWGRDGDHRAEQETPAPANHNWQHGLRRLVLGYGMAEGDVLIDGTTPAGLDRWGFHVGAHDYELLGRFGRFTDLALALDGWVSRQHTAAEWAECLRTDILDAFFAAPAWPRAEGAMEVNTVARVIDDFANECRNSRATGPIPFAVLRDVLQEHARKASRATPRLADGITVASLAPGQIFPARIVCAVGLDNGAFPRTPARPPFDFLVDLFEGDARRPGDRQPRDEDRLAFLEALLSARDAFLVTYTGRDLQEGQPIPPSVVVSELLEHLEQRSLEAQNGGEAGRPRFEIEHPLQPFSPLYFPRERQAAGLFSYSQPMAETAAAASRRIEPPSRFEGALEPPAREASEIEVEELIRFAFSPSQHFTRSRLGLMLSRRKEDLADDEPLALDQLGSWQLKDSLSRREGQAAERSLAWGRASGLLPPGNLGDMTQRDTAAEWRLLEQELGQYAEHRKARPRVFDLELEGRRLVGAVHDFHEEKGELLFWRIGKVRPKDEIAVWLRLLALACATERPLTARMFGIRGKVEKKALDGPAPEEARAALGSWLRAWDEGRIRPLPFFAGASMAWCERRLKQDGSGEDPSAASEAARKAATEAALRSWESNFGEGKDACHALLFGDDPTGEEFEHLAQELLTPLVQARR